ncbi:MFS monocarboxylate transporter [Hortaea werneckii]|nr:MFS monocarboxylate transporter [Hortaea werneckii]KAI7095019.1 MFS monocarboxylate transporter [Hortaea werneckii]KAI7225815.1 MFS monocarboxylate transporter [Hortaea werneckii]KAI7302351.1 MFS monocarboxylate transporter [Hortaea werneckii]KAI7396104.1 MFS monocarboxylate transporter [Hortaea werneckii]
MSKEIPRADIDVATGPNSQASEQKQPELTLRSGLAGAGAALSYFTTVGFANAFGVFQDYYYSNVLRGHSNFQISWLGSFSMFALFAFAPPAGILADKYGPTLPMAFGSICMLVAVFMISLCKAYYQFFLAQGLLLGVGMSFIAIPASGVVPRYFKRNRGLATGVTVAGSSLGGIVWPIIFDQLLHQDDVEFPWAMRIAGFVMLPICAICVLTVRPPKQPKQSDNESATNDTPTKPQKDTSALRKAPFILLCVGEFVAVFGFFPPLFYISTYATSLGMSPSLAFYLVSIVNGASSAGRILPGIVADRYGRFNLLALSAFSAAIIAFCWTPAQSIAGVVVWTVAFGFASGAILSLQLGCATSLVDENSAGAAVGAVMGAMSLASLFATPIAGQLVKHGFLPVSCFAGATMFVGGCLIAASRLAQNRDIRARV